MRIYFFLFSFFICSSANAQSSIAISPEVGISRIDGDIRHDKGRIFGLDLGYNYKLWNAGLWSYHSRNYGQNLNSSDFQGTYIGHTSSIYANYKATSTSFGLQVGVGNSHFRRNIYTGRMIFEVSAGVGLSLYSSRSNYLDGTLNFYDAEEIQQGIEDEIEQLDGINIEATETDITEWFLNKVMDNTYETMFLENEPLFVKKVSASMGWSFGKRVILRGKLAAIFHNNDSLDSLDWIKWEADAPDNDTLLYGSIQFSYIIDIKSGTSDKN